MSREDDLKRVNWDPDLHRYHKEHGRWDKWIQSPEYGRAFRAYWKKGTVPWRIYPKALIQKNSREGTVTHLPLEGYQDWKDTEKGDRAYWDFMCTAIYNRELAGWCKRQRQIEKQRRNNHRHQPSIIKFPRLPHLPRLSLPKPINSFIHRHRLLTWIVIAVFIFYLVLYILQRIFGVIITHRTPYLAVIQTGIYDYFVSMIIGPIGILLVIILALLAVKGLVWFQKLSGWR